MAADFADQAKSPQRRVARLRIESTTRSSSLGRSGGVARAGGQGFVLDDEPAASRVANADPLTGATGIDALLALQAVDDPLLARKKAIRRGRSLLDTLESMKADLLTGQVSEGRLNHLMAVVTSARDRNLPGLDALLDDIELRARVELAKFGRYPGL
jgi:Class II flagellar assembly regulator